MILEKDSYEFCGLETRNPNLVTNKGDVVAEKYEGKFKPWLTWWGHDVKEEASLIENAGWQLPKNRYKLFV